MLQLKIADQGKIKVTPIIVPVWELIKGMELWTNKLERWTQKRRCEPCKDLKIRSAWTELFFFNFLGRQGYFSYQSSKEDTLK